MVKIHTDDEMKEFVKVGFNLIDKVKKLRNTVIEEHDEGEECPLCGTEYAIPDRYIEFGVSSVECPNGNCIFNEVELEVKKLGNILHSIDNYGHCENHFWHEHTKESG